MFALSFRFPAGRYHATPWERNANEADVAWPPEPWRLLRALIAVWWRKGDRDRWTEDEFANLIDRLAETLPEYSLPVGAIHAHTRHYMPTGSLVRGRPKTTLVFDGFVRLPSGSTLVVAWPRVTLPCESFALAADLAGALGYLGRAESWTECEAIAKWSGVANCRPLDGDTGDYAVRLLASHTPDAYSAERRRILNQVKRQTLGAAKRRLTPKGLSTSVDRQLRSRGRKAHTLPERLVDALTLDTADYRDLGWSRPLAAREVVYGLAPEAARSVISRRSIQHRSPQSRQNRPTVARFLLAGRPLPRIEDAVKIGELMRRATLARFGWRRDESTGRMRPKAPPEISGRGIDGRPLRNPSHTHAFWLPEDADGDGWIDHVSVFVASGMNDRVRYALDGVTRLWLQPRQRRKDDDVESGSVKEWRLALEGFGKPADFAEGAHIFAKSDRWISVTPFLASGHLKRAGYPGEVRRLLKRRGIDATGFQACELDTIFVGGRDRRAIHFYRFRSRGWEAQPDTAGALLRIEFPSEIEGPLAIGYGSHFGLGLFEASGGRSPI